jgi:thiamine monophosphate kinase
VPVHGGAESPADALVSGEEYELLAALPEGAGHEVGSAFEEAFGLQFTRVGRVEAGSGVTLLENGAPVAPPGGFTHF